MQRKAQSGQRDDENHRPNEIERSGLAREIARLKRPGGALRPLAGERRLSQMAISREPALGALADDVSARLAFRLRAADSFLKIVEPSAFVLLVDRIGDEAGDFAFDLDQIVENRVALGFDAAKRSAGAIGYGLERLGVAIRRRQRGVHLILFDIHAHTLPPQRLATPPPVLHPLCYARATLMN